MKALICAWGGGQSRRPSPRLRGQRTHLSADPPGSERRGLRAEKLLGCGCGCGCGWLRLRLAARILPRGSARQTRERLGEPRSPSSESGEQGRPATMGTLCQQPLQDFHISQFSHAGT
eukprot:bmy_10055T0